MYVRSRLENPETGGPVTYMSGARRRRLLTRSARPTQWPVWRRGKRAGGVRENRSRHSGGHGFSGGRAFLRFVFARDRRTRRHLFHVVVFRRAALQVRAQCIRVRVGPATVRRNRGRETVAGEPAPSALTAG